MAKSFCYWRLMGFNGNYSGKFFTQHAITICRFNFSLCRDNTAYWFLPVMATKGINYQSRIYNRYYEIGFSECYYFGAHDGHHY